MRNVKHRLIVMGMALTTAIAFIASTAGTLAWYAYSTRTLLSFTGTSVRKSELIHIGLVDGKAGQPSTYTFSDIELTNYELTRESCGENSIVWTTSSTGFPTEAIKTYLSRNSSSYNYLSPVSSGPRDKNGSLTLHQSIGFGQKEEQNVFYFKNTDSWASVYAYAWNGVTNNGAYPGEAMTVLPGTSDVYKIILDQEFDNIQFSDGGNVNKTAELAILDYKNYYNDGGWFDFAEDRADTTQYVTLPFAFKSIGSDNQPDPDVKVWLTGADVECNGQHINEAVRVHVKNPTEEYLFNPSIATGTEGQTKLAGLLDLDGDGTYDFDVNDGNKEFVYGFYSGDPTYSDTPYSIPVPPATYDPVNVNGVDLVKFQDMSTFYAKHKDGAYVANLNSVTIKNAKYYTLGGIIPNLDGNGYFDEQTGKPITITGHEDGIGYATITVYLEGWDHAVINAAIGYKFNLGLTFEINKI